MGLEYGTDGLQFSRKTSFDKFHNNETSCNTKNHPCSRPGNLLIGSSLSVGWRDLRHARTKDNAQWSRKLLTCLGHFHALR